MSQTLKHITKFFKKENDRKYSNALSELENKMEQETQEQHRQNARIEVRHQHELQKLRDNNQKYEQQLAELKLTGQRNFFW